MKFGRVWIFELLPEGLRAGGIGKPEYDGELDLVLVHLRGVRLESGIRQCRKNMSRPGRGCSSGSLRSYRHGQSNGERQGRCVPERIQELGSAADLGGG